MGRYRTSVVLALALLLPLSACGPEGELEEPVPLFDDVPIEYPLSLWDERVEGTTVLRVWVAVDGSVDSTRVLEPSGHEAFDSAAVRGGRRLRFDPATREGEPVGVWAHVPVHFSLEGERPPGVAGGAGEASPGDDSSADASSEAGPPGAGS